jgi:hypothetical protein
MSRSSKSYHAMSRGPKSYHAMASQTRKTALSHSWQRIICIYTVRPNIFHKRRFMCSLWMEGFTESEVLLRRILPPGVLDLLVKPATPLVKPAAAETVVKLNPTPVAAMQQQQQRPTSGDASDPPARNGAHAVHGAGQSALATAAAARAPDSSAHTPSHHHTSSSESVEGAEGASAARRKAWMDFFQALEMDHLVGYTCI